MGWRISVFLALGDFLATFILGIFFAYAGDRFHLAEGIDIVLVIAISVVFSSILFSRVSTRIIGAGLLTLANVPLYFFGVIMQLGEAF